jgi:hypothetical protein
MGRVSLTADGDPGLAQAQLVTGGAFETLGLPLALGRGISIEDDKAEVTKDFAEQIKKQRRALDLLAHEVSTGTEVRPVECDLVPRRADEMMDVIRPDTGEVVSSRPWTQSERDTFKQRALPFERDDESDNAH